MESTPIQWLVLHGGVLVFVGLLAGLRYGVAIVRDPEGARTPDWRIAHIQNLQNGMLLLLAAACASYLELSESALVIMVWALVLSAYTDMTAWFIRAWTGHKGVLPDPPVGNLVVFALFSFTVVGQFAGVSIFIFGAWRAFG